MVKSADYRGKSDAENERRNDESSGCYADGRPVDVRHDAHYRPEAKIDVG